MSRPTMLADPVGTRQRVIGPFGFFALSFGSIVGSGWVVVLGDWLRTANGPGGALAAFVAGGIVMCAIGACYAELASRMPRAGGEVLYTLESFGRGAAFFVGWFLSLYLIALLGFEAIVLAWLLQTLFPVLRGEALYTAFGTSVTVDALAIGIAASLFYAYLNWRGTRSTTVFQNVVTYGFAGCAILMIAAGLILGSPENLLPLYAPADSASGLGPLWTFATCAMFLNGFQAAAYSIEQRRADAPIRTVLAAMVLGIAASALFYCGIILAAGSAVPWQTLVAADLPAVRAFAALTDNGVFGSLILVVAIVSLAKAYNGIASMAVRLLHAQAELGFLPKAFLQLDRTRGTPVIAVLFVLLANLAGVLVGRGAIVTIVNMCSICLAISFVFCLAILVHRRRRAQEPAEFAVPGGALTIAVGLAGAVVMALVALWDPVPRSAGIPTEWIMIAGWALAGLGLWRLTPGIGAAQR